jgi:hypothetical protein
MPRLLRHVHACLVALALLYGLFSASSVVTDGYFSFGRLEILAAIAAHETREASGRETTTTATDWQFCQSPVLGQSANASHNMPTLYQCEGPDYEAFG